MDCLSSIVQDQPGHHGEIPSLKKIQKVDPFHKMAPKAKKEAPAPPKAEAKEKALKAGKRPGAVAHACNPSTLGG